ncbi:FdtA/QdtA family cupin domain-containing protein [Simiduia litorea]|uniref:sugar 3,4-ketoisomerase n=1 Tax=Simiduia litorea TaxID=1435348 RepID=UPI0036F2FC30
MSLIKQVLFKNLGDERGSLIALEENKNIPFDIKRIYYIYDAEACTPRGFHAHKKLEQVAICVKGSCRFILDDAKGKADVILDSPEYGLYVGDMIWHEMHDFSSDCVLLVLASDFYDEADYIRNYGEFLEKVRHG